MKRVYISAVVFQWNSSFYETMWKILDVHAANRDPDVVDGCLRKKAKDTIIEVKSLEMCLRLKTALEIVTFCYEYGIQLDLIGEGQNLLRNALVSAFEAQNRVSREVASATIHDLINGEGQTLIKSRDTKSFSVDEVQETK